jgi:hypothetical protein
MFALVDEETLVDGRHLVVARFATEHEAMVWLDLHHDQEKVYRGGFGLDGPSD